MKNTIEIVTIVRCNLSMAKETKLILENTAKSIFAKGGYDALSMRTLSKESSVGLSSIYNYFEDKDKLLKSIFDQTNKHLGLQRKLLPNRKTAKKMLEDRIAFQFKHIEDVVFVLKYYLHYRPYFLRINSGYIPAKAYLHIDEVIAKGISTGEYSTSDPVADAKIMAHAINGFLLEYFPDTPKGKELSSLIVSLTNFLNRSMASSVKKGGDYVRV